MKISPQIIQKEKMKQSTYRTLESLNHKFTRFNQGSINLSISQSLTLGKPYALKYNCQSILSNILGDRLIKYNSNDLTPRNRISLVKITPKIHSNCDLS
jgi:hypothetical protein